MSCYDENSSKWLVSAPNTDGDLPFYMLSGDRILANIFDDQMPGLTEWRPTNIIHPYYILMFRTPRQSLRE